MRCLDDVQVLDYVERRLPEAELTEVRDHLDACGDCLNLVSQLSQPATGTALDGLVLGRTISSGGMGVIVEAYDAKLERRIAVKLPRTDEPTARRRFEREVRITARLQHPAIVPVYAAGTLDDGEPYYAMRLVDGDTLDAAITRSRTAADRLALVRVVTTVAGAIAYAHSQSIIHRDIKPANVLVGRFGEVVLIDWGLARSTRTAPHADDGELADGSPGPAAASVAGDGETETVGGAVLGTPAYMAPEQARGEPIDERADIYALGALLYHVLSGRPPGRGAPADLVADGDLPRDLIAIVTGAMAPDPAERYATAGELAVDLERFQAGRLVGAHDYSLGQLVRRWLRKHRTAVIVAAVLAVVVAVTAVVASRRIDTAEDTATAQRAASDDLVGYMLADLQTRLTDVGRLDVLAGIGANIDAYYVALGGSPARLSAIDRARWSRALDILGDVAEQAGALAKAKALFERALALRQELAASGERRSETLALLATSQSKLGGVQRATGETAAAAASYEAARRGFAELVVLEPTRREHRRQEGLALANLGGVELERFAAPAARERFTAALAIGDELVAADPGKTSYVLLKLAALRGLVDVTQYTGDLEAASVRASEALAIAERLAVDDPGPDAQRSLGTTLQRQADVRSKQGDRAGALAAHRRAAEVFERASERDPSNAVMRSSLALAINRVGGVERALGHRAEAEAAFERARALRQALVDLEPNNLIWLRDLGDSHDRLGALLLDLGRLDDADRHFAAGIAITEQLIASEPNPRYRDDLRVGFGKRAMVARARGDSDAALGWYRKRLEVAQANSLADPSNHGLAYSLSVAYDDVSTILMDRNDPAGARDAAAKSLAILERLVAGSPTHVKWRRALATALESLATSQDEATDARVWIAKAIPHRRELVGIDRDDTELQIDLVLALSLEARIARAMDDYTPASASATEALALLEPLIARDPANLIWASYRAQAHEVSGDIAADQGHADEAARRYRAAIDAIAPFLDDKLDDAHIAGEIAESKWKLSKVVGKAERTRLIGEAIALLEALARAKRLSPAYAAKLAEMKAEAP